MTWPATTNGPDRYHGSSHCEDHHNGIRDGIVDWCCCCDPCLYEKPSQVTRFSCRCVPQMICFTFTPDDDSDPCAKVITVGVVPVYSETDTPGIISYDAFELSLRIYDGEWQLWDTDPLTMLDSIRIDHKTTTCLEVPSFVATSFVWGGVTGSVSFTASPISKIPFVNRNSDSLWEQPPADITDSPCDETKAAMTLCVTGRRHVDGPIESVEFGWNTDLGDRWQYLPPKGDPAHDREVIYLRGDGYGNCFLELDFEQDGPNTNDWAIPPTSDGDTSKMVPVAKCNCGMFERTTSGSGPGSRFVTIIGAPCSKFKYVCGNCRCVPTYLCVIGEIDGVLIDSRATWNLDDGSYGWVLDSDPSVKIILTNYTQQPPFDDARVMPCALTVTGTFSVPFQTSSAVHCGIYVGGEILSESDSSVFNWLWVSASNCSLCAVSTCGACPSRCGANPLTLFVDLHAQDNGSDDPYDPTFGVVTNCDLTVEVHYWQRWNPTSRGTPECGYIGYSAPITCGADTYVIKVYMENFGVTGTVSRRYISGPIFDDFGPTGYDELNDVWKGPEFLYNQGPVTFDEGTIVCEPLYSQTPTITSGSHLWCMWGCNEPVDEYTVTVYE